MTRRLLLLPVIALALGSLTGCSLGQFANLSPSSASPSPTRTDSVGNGDDSSPKPSDAPSGDAAGSGGTSAADFPCNLYPIASIADLTGFKITRATPVTAVGEPDQKSCLYDTADGSHEFATEIALSNAAAHLQTWSLIENTGAAVAGIGDSAWGDDSQLAAVYGSVYVEAGDQSDASNDDTPLVHIGIDKLELLIGGLYAATLKG